MYNNYGEFITELEGHYDKIIKMVAPVGERLSIKLSQKNVPEPFIISHDILRRLVSNIRVLRGIKISNDTCVAFRLILRATTADLIEAIYLLTLSEKERDEEIFKRNLDAVRTLQTYFIDKKEFFDKVTPDGCDIDLSAFYDKYRDYVDSSTGRLYSKKQYRKKPTSDMGKALVKAEILSEEYCQMYTNYKILSLTEHYSPIARRYSFNLENDEIVFIDVVRWLVIGTETICKIITEWLDMGEFRKI